MHHRLINSTLLWMLVKQESTQVGPPFQSILIVLIGGPFEGDHLEHELVAMKKEIWELKDELITTKAEVNQWKEICCDTDDYHITMIKELHKQYETLSTTWMERDSVIRADLEEADGCFNCHR